jgi:hypothetical protein
MGSASMSWLSIALEAAGFLFLGAAFGARKGAWPKAPDSSRSRSTAEFVGIY